MSVPHVALTDSQHRLLAELALSTLPVPELEEEFVVAPGLTPQQMRADVTHLRWMGLIAEVHGTLSITALGAAVFHRAEQETAESRLVEVAAFADALDAVPEVDQRRVSYALRQLAQGVYSLDEAVGYVS
jgi:hypothetical protein